MSLSLTGLVDCLECGTTYEGAWTDKSSDTVQDMDEPPEQDQVCPGCGRVQMETWPGWVFRSEAGLRHKVGKVMALSRNEQLARMPRKYVMCRVFYGHHTPGGEPQIFAAPGGGFESVFTCIFCGTEISKFRDRHGFVTAQRRYNYPSVEDGAEPYVMQEGGQLTKGEKADLFLQEARVAGKVRKLPTATSRKPAARKTAARKTTASRRRGSAS